MRVQWKPEQLWKLLDKYKYVLLALAAGVALLLWPAGGEEKPAPSAPDAVSEEFDLAALEEKLSQTLSQVEGAGKVTVTLTLKSGMEQVPVTDRTTSAGERENRTEEKTVVVGSGSDQEAVVRLRRYPVFQGALVVCEGADQAEVRLAMTQAVSALTGLGTDRVTICKGAG